LVSKEFYFEAGLVVSVRSEWDVVGEGGLWVGGVVAVAGDGGEFGECGVVASGVLD